MRTMVFCLICVRDIHYRYTIEGGKRLFIISVLCMRTLEGFRKRVTAMNTRNTLIVIPRILYEFMTDTGEITNYDGSSCNMSTAANVIPQKW